MKISVAIPFYPMKNHEFFLRRCLDSVASQSYTNYEIIVTQDGKMAENTNQAMSRAQGDVIKVLYMDDFLAHKDALKLIVEAWKPETQWLVTGCSHEPGTHHHLPTWNDQIERGVNTIGSPSILAVRNEGKLLFDEELSWLLDCDLYRRYYDTYGLPTILNDINVTIGVGEHQTTHLLPDSVKLKEHEYLKKKYDSRT